MEAHAAAAVPGATSAHGGRAPLARLARWLRSGETPQPRDAEDAAALVAAARAQRLAPLLFTAVRGRTGWTATALEELRESHHGSFAEGARHLDLAGRLLGVLAAAGVRVLPMKGVALLQRAYASPADRPMGDVDLLVLDGWREAVAALAGASFEVEGRADHAWTYRDPQGAEHRAAPRRDLVSGPVRPGRRRRLGAQRRAVGPQLPRGAATEDLLVQLALHAAFQHGAVLTLCQYLDFKRLLASEPIDAVACRQIASRSGAEAALGVSLAVADALVGVPEGAALRDWGLSLAPSGLRRWLDGRLTDPTWFLPPRPVPLLRLRWGLAAGRRRALLAGTLAPEEPPGAAERSRGRARIFGSNVE
jgi:hypothetical protein